MKKKITNVLLVNIFAIALVFGALGVVFADNLEDVNSDAVIGGTDYIEESTVFPEVTAKIAEIDDPIKQALIAKYLHIPTKVEFTITSWTGEEFLVTTDGIKAAPLDKENLNAVSLCLGKIDELMDMSIEELQSEISIKEVQAETVMEEFTQELSYEDLISNLVESNSQFQVNGDSSPLLAAAVTSYWCTFTKEVYGEIDLLMRFRVQMDWQVDGTTITYCAPTSSGQGYDGYTYTGASTNGPTVYTTYATLVSKIGYFSDSATARIITVAMPSLRVNNNGTYSPTGTIY
ncbi:MAG: hypothetical protein LBL49_05625 [Clostridiales Family XIII bacterium]|nr:hypothetical protein [Clostridiales Family XIII bacterium]